MIIVKLSGGLGNQMFQYVFGQYLGEKFNAKVEYNIDFYANQDPRLDFRNYELYKFDIDVPISTNQFVKAYNRKNKLGKILLLISSFFSYKNDTFLVIREPESLLMTVLSYLFSNKYYVGYWQNVKFFLYLENKILEWFVLKEQYLDNNLDQLVDNKSFVSIGVRRGDYTTLGVSCDLYYYQMAIKLVAKKVKNPNFLIFSDDIEWCKSNLKLDGFSHTYVLANTFNPFVDLKLMSMCHHNIISNSTFGWWAAYLNRNKEKIIISPKEWRLSAQISCTKL